jgi:hypothetical protein
MHAQSPVPGEKRQACTWPCGPSGQLASGLQRGSAGGSRSSSVQGIVVVDVEEVVLDDVEVVLLVDVDVLVLLDVLDVLDELVDDEPGVTVVVVAVPTHCVRWAIAKSKATLTDRPPARRPWKNAVPEIRPAYVTAPGVVQA